MLLLTYFFILTDYDFKYFIKWKENQWFNTKHELNNIENEELLSVIRDIGEIINKADKKQVFNLKAKDHFYYIIKSKIDEKN